MRRLILALASLIVASAPILAATEAEAQNRERDRRAETRGEQRQPARPSRQDSGQGYGGPQARDPRDYGPSRTPPNVRSYGRPQQAAPQWDDRRYNGYYYNNQWVYGRPPQTVYGRPGYAPGYTAWRRGGVLPPTYRGAAIADYRRLGLRPPPAGYAWYQAGDQYLLAGIASGIIFDIIGR